MAKRTIKLKFKRIIFFLILISIVVLVFVKVDYPEEVQLDTEPYQNILILVNDQNSLPEDYISDIVKYENSYVSSYIKEDLDDMINDAKKDNVLLIINNAYRSSDEQADLFNNQVSEYLEEGLAYEEAYELTESKVNLPKHSEHETGLAIDFSGYNNELMWEWLSTNSYKYGFVLRYSNDKTTITGIEYEPWHYRYVGKTVAKIMFEENLCLEEYLEKYKDRDNF